MGKRLQDNPLFNTGEPQKQQEPPIETKLSESRRGKPRKENLVRSGVQNGLTDEWTRACFIIRVDSLKQLKEIAYEDHVTIKEALDEILKEYFDQRETKRIESMKRVEETVEALKKIAESYTPNNGDGNGLTIEERKAVADAAGVLSSMGQK